MTSGPSQLRTGAMLISGVTTPLRLHGAFNRPQMTGIIISKILQS